MNSAYMAKPIFPDFNTLEEVTEAQSKQHEPVVIVLADRELKKPFFVVYFPDAIRGLRWRTHDRTIIPRNEDDFIQWMYEFIHFWRVQPIAANEYIAEKIDGLLQEKTFKHRGETFQITWKKSYRDSKEWIDTLNEIRNESVFKLSEVVEMMKQHGIDINERAIRHYEDEGLLPHPLKIGKFKMYSQETIDKIHKIKRLQSKEGKTVKEIKEIMDRNWTES